MSALLHFLRRHLPLVWWVIAVFAGMWPQTARALEPVTLQLKWTHSFQFAGYYAAQQKGYYREAGLDVTIAAAQPGDDPVTKVLAGEAQYGVGNSNLLLARNAGQPVVLLAAIFQHSPVVFIARAQLPVQGIQDLKGKRVMLEHQSDELLAYLKQEGVNPNDIIQVDHSFNINDLIENKVDAISAYIVHEPYFLEKIGFPYYTYTPRSVGIDFYGDNLFTTEQEIKNHPARTKAFRQASLRGWEYAMAHPEEIADFIVNHYAQEHLRELYLFEAKRIEALLRTDLIEIGYSNPGRWQHISEIYASMGLLPHKYSLKGFIYEQPEATDLTWLYVGLLLLASISTVALYIYSVNRRLTQALQSSKEDHQRLKISEERHRLLADNANDIIWMMNLDGRFTYVSPSVYKLRGYTSEEVMQQTMEEALTANSIPIAQKALGASIQSMLNGKSFISFRGELEQPCKDGSTVWTEVTTSGMRNPKGQFIGILGVSRNINERKQMEEQVKQLAFYDALTQLPNRRLLNDRFTQRIAMGQCNGLYGALIFLDLDNFKSLNDKHGHAAGDLLLIEAATRLKHCVRGSDTVARFGGDEFVVLINELAPYRTESVTQAMQIAEKIRVTLAHTYRFTLQREGEDDVVIEHHCSASIGVALFIDDEASPEDILKWADKTMYEAKAAGRNQIRLHNGQITSHNSL